VAAARCFGAYCGAVQTELSEPLCRAFILPGEDDAFDLAAILSVCSIITERPTYFVDINAAESVLVRTILSMQNTADVSR
jgi:hypothetical protein